MLREAFYRAAAAENCVMMIVTFLRRVAFSDNSITMNFVGLEPRMAEVVR